jgi:streptomycin 6-kinase
VECVYYYNTFVGMTSKLAGDLSDCEVAMQERHHHFAAVLSFERRPFMAIDPAGLKFREAAF